MNAAVIVFPGSNCDRDVKVALARGMGREPLMVWHRDSDFPKVDLIVLPGGFSYGDYLRCGAIARFSPIMKEVVSFANRGGTVIGICNGFQILCEAGLLPGALLRNEQLTFVCKFVNLRVEDEETMFTNRCHQSEVLNIPIAHGEGNYYVDDATLQELEANRQILFRYCEPNGLITQQANPNGSRSNIAGIVNKLGNVMGMMPHPERAADPTLGPTDGQKIFSSLLARLGVNEEYQELEFAERI
jgi:phosphoribosylformylglycinamidine synthase